MTGGSRLDNGRSSMNSVGSLSADSVEKLEILEKLNFRRKSFTSNIPFI
jgi:hypothetical protein